MISSQQIATDREDELNLIALCRMVRDYKYLVWFVTGLSGLAAVLLAFTLPPVYRAEVVVTELDDGNMSSAATLANELGGFASLAGLNLATQGSGRRAQAVLESRRLAEQFIQHHDLLLELFPEHKPGLLVSALRQGRQRVYCDSPWPP